jgi:glycosyltransferase involved in cell wall biosynthesis
MAHFLPDAVGSIMRQAVPVQEIVIVHPPDDHDTASVGNMLSGQGAPVILQHVQSVGTGTGPPTNIGLAHASGEVLAFLDADDLWPRDKLSLQIGRLASLPLVDAVGGLTMRFDALDEQTLRPVADARISVEVLPNTGAFVCRRNVFDKTGPFDEDFLYAIDVDFVMRLRDFGVPFTVLDKPTLYYRQHANSMMSAIHPRQVSDFRLAAMKSVRRRRTLGLPPADKQVLTGYLEQWPRETP